jgi:hypothetical protein
MAYTARDFEIDLAAYSAGAIIGVTRSRKMLGYAAKKGLNVLTLAARRAVIPASRAALGVARRNPVTAVGLAGYGAYRAGAFDPIEEAIQVEVNRRMGQFETIEMAASDPFIQESVKKVAKRKVSNYAKGIKAGMKALRASKFNGKPGELSNAKKSFGTVSKTVSALMRGKKVRRIGATGTIARATSKLPGITKITVRK